jgi:hypothetical protein
VYLLKVVLCVCVCVCVCDVCVVFVLFSRTYVSANFATSLGSNAGAVQFLSESGWLIQ